SRFLKVKEAPVSCRLAVAEGHQDGVFAAEAECEQDYSVDMDPMKAQQLAAELEVEMMADMYNRMTNACHRKCVPPHYKEAELTKGESVCLDRCVAKYLDLHERLGRKLTELSVQDEEMMRKAADETLDGNGGITGEPAGATTPGLPETAHCSTSLSGCRKEELTAAETSSDRGTEVVFLSLGDKAFSTVPARNVMEASDEELVGGADELAAPPNGVINELLNVGQQDNMQGEVEEFLGPQAEYNEEEEERKYYRRKRLGVIKNVLAASVGAMIVYSVYMGLLQMQLILHYDMTYREVKYSNLGLEDIDRKMLMGINVTPIIGLLYTPVLIRMAQQYYEYVNYKEEHVQEQKKLPKGACHRYIIIFQSVFNIIFHADASGANISGVIPGFNTTVLTNLPRSMLLIQVESVLMGFAFLAMIIFLVLCGAAYRPTEEIDLRSIGWGNIFQLPFKHLRDYRLRLLCPFFIYSGFEVLFAVSGFSLSYGVCILGLHKLWLLILVYGLSCSVFSSLCLGLLRLPRWVCLMGGAAVHVVLLVVLLCFSLCPHPDEKSTQYLGPLLVIIALWGLGTALNKTVLLGMLYAEEKERLDFVYTIYHWWQAIAIFIVYLWSNLPMRVKGYRYLEEDNSDESDSEKSEEDDEEDGEHVVEERGAEGGEDGGHDAEVQGADSPGARRRGTEGQRRRQDHADGMEGRA
ncbi:hypothetical protein FQN60_011598, partial [Etheostoma spectabile]